MMPLRVSPVSRRAFTVMRVEGSYPLPNCSHWSSEVWEYQTKLPIHGEFPENVHITLWICKNINSCEVHEMMYQNGSNNVMSMPRIFTNKVQRSFLKTFFSWICVSRTKAILVATTMICSNAPSDLSLQLPMHMEYSFKICWNIRDDHQKSFLWWIKYHIVTPWLSPFRWSAVFFFAVYLQNFVNLSAIQHHSTPLLPPLQNRQSKQSPPATGAASSPRRRWFRPAADRVGPRVRCHRPLRHRHLSRELSPDNAKGGTWYLHHNRPGFSGQVIKCIKVSHHSK